MAEKLILTGRVQRVGCRQYCTEYAGMLGIHGSATNNADGSVTVLLDADDSLVSVFISRLMNNPEGVLFFGEIKHIERSPYTGPLSGDYVF